MTGTVRVCVGWVGERWCMYWGWGWGGWLYCYIHMHINSTSTVQYTHVHALTYKQMMLHPLFRNASHQCSHHKPSCTLTHINAPSTHTRSLSDKPQTVGGCQPFLTLTASLVHHTAKRHIALICVPGISSLPFLSVVINKSLLKDSIWRRKMPRVVMNS